MRTTAPLVTIGIPNYNYAHYIKEALDSVANQTYQHIELIIVDDCSTDDSVVEIENWINNYSGDSSINFIKNKINLGLTGTCNVILKNARGKYFQTLDADDLLLPGKIEKQVALMEREIDAAFVYSNIEIIDENGKIINTDYLQQIGYDENKMPQGNIFEALFDFNFVPLPSVLINTEMARAAGGFDEKQQVQDYYMWLKLSEKHDVLYLNEKTAYYRSHHSSMSRSAKTNPRSVESVLNIKYRYFKNSSKAIQDIIKKNIHFSAAYLYEHKIASAAKWLKRDLIYNPGLKSFGYFVAIHLGIPFSFFNSIKKKTAAKQTNTN